MDLVKLLEFLADGEYHSGVEMGAALGVSRTAVWKALGKLESDGVALEVTKGKGYRVRGGLDLLDYDVIVSRLQLHSDKLDSVCVLQDVDSTNSYLMRGDLLTSGYSVCLAERQTLGRGRRGRTWHSPYAKNIYLSMAFGLSGGAEVLEGLSLALGVAVANCLSDQGIQGVGLKWPNDIWVDGKKLAGILVELKGEAEFGWKVVAGLGINVLMSENDGRGVGQPWTSLELVSGKQTHDRSLWSAFLIESLIETIERYRTNGLSSLLDDWSKFDILAGKEVTLSGVEGGGVCHGVDSRGRLLVDIGGKVTVVNAGEVSVRPNESTD
ncbi:biotin--[acetyl-CoA-carboxylase] ligase [Alkalimarinus alittae]|uniref:Bifunctional ligase/repressor BirA n=1 Tax=Alkalimarinus alittae TaxID=2961619 RepID=A0ABY6N162_9ALTE|nr:biotin--[acetyl-CoA-carboxylase] ligase [Alkalimarinus alittae]UZE95848.1 biotin--[acetyl-CoA-carboxylase] ligase [Alkalimarinus alittae]